MKAGLIGAGIHTFIVLAVFLKVLTLSDGTKTDWFVGPWEVKT